MAPLSSSALVALLLPLFAFTSGAGACEDSVCFTDEEARTGGSCEADDGKDADYNRYYNLTAGTEDVGVDVRSRFGCLNEQPRPGANNEYDEMYTTMTVKTPGRNDQILLLYSYGDMYDCSFAAIVDPDRTFIFNFREGVGTHTPCGETEPVPSIAEALP